MASLLLFILPIMVLVFGLMAVGVLLGRKPIQGTCGGIAARAGDAGCPLCGGNPARCESVADAVSDTADEQAYDAAARPPPGTDSRL